MKKPLFFAALSRRVAGINEQAQLYFDTIRRTPVVVSPSGDSLPLENRSAKGVAGGYASLGPTALVPTSQLGTGTANSSSFLRGDGTWAAGGGGGGTLDHAALTSNLAWTTSAHTGTASRIAGFSGAGAAAEYTGAGVLDLLLTTRGDMPLRGAGTTARLPVGAANYLLLSDGTDPAWASPASVRTALSLVVGTNVQAWDADLDGLAGLGNGLPIRSAGTWTVGTISAPLTLTGSTLAVSAASTSAAGVVELATDGEAIADRAVQGNDSRLGTAGGSSVAMAVWAGTGAGGDVTLDGTAVPSWASVSTIGGVRTYTVTSEAVIELDVVTFDFNTYSSIAVVTKGAIFCIREIVTTGTGTAYFDWTGGNASTSTAGLGAAQVGAGSPLAGGGTGAAGRNTTGAGVNVGSNMPGLSLGGTGGAGGAIGASPGGNGGSLFRDFLIGVSKYGSVGDIIQRGSGLLWTNTTTATQYQIMGGAGGGSGANQTTGVSGGGGGGGGAVLLRVGRIDTGANTLYLRANAGNGAAGSGVSGAGTSAGGGGGAGGGVLLVVATVTGTVVLQSHGGSGGNGVTNDADVAAGGAGGNGGLVACIYGSGTAPTGTATGGTGGTGSGGAAAANGSAGTVHIVSAVL